MASRRQRSIRTIFSLRFLKDLYAEVEKDNVFNGAAALGFYLTLSLFPALIALMSVLPYIPIRDIDRAIMELMRQGMPSEAAKLVEDIVSQVTSKERGGLLSFGLLATLWAASNGMYAIMQQLNVIYDVKEGRSFIKARATALGLIFLFGALIISAFSLVVLGGSMERWIGENFGQSTLLVMTFKIFRWVIIVFALLLGLGVVYRYAPNVEERFRLISPGGLVGVGLLALASLGFSIYINNFSNYNKTYGSIGAVIVLMLWLYIIGLVVLIGSEINALLGHTAPDATLHSEPRDEPKPSYAPATLQGGLPRPRPTA